MERVPMQEILETISIAVGLIITIAGLIYGTIKWIMSKTYYTKENLDDQLKTRDKELAKILKEHNEKVEESLSVQKEEHDKSLKDTSDKIDGNIVKIFDLMNDKANKADVRRLEDKLDLKAGKEDVIRLENKFDRMTEMLIEFKSVLAYKNDCEGKK